MATDAQAEGVRFQAFFARVASDSLWIRRVSEEITDAIHRELAAPADDDELRAVTFASVRSVLTLMADMVRLGRPASEGVPPPDAIAYVREFVHRGLAVDALLRAYQDHQDRLRKVTPCPMSPSPPAKTARTSFPATWCSPPPMGV